MAITTICRCESLVTACKLCHSIIRHKSYNTGYKTSTHYDQIENGENLSGTEFNLKLITTKLSTE